MNRPCCVGADLMEFAAPEIAEVVSGRKTFKTAAKSVGIQTLRKQLGSGSIKRTASRVIPTKSSKQISRSRRHIFEKHISLIKSFIFWHHSFVAVPGNLGGKIPAVDDVLSSHEQGFFSTTSLDENCIEFDFKTDQNYYVDLRQTYSALKLKLVRSRSYETYNSKKVEEEHKEGAELDDSLE